MEALHLSPTKAWLLAIVAALMVQSLNAQTTPEAIDLDAAALDFDGKRQKVVLRQVVIKQGSMSISADNAVVEEIDFKNSLWLFQDNVSINANQTKIVADEASLKFVDHELQLATVTGSPATFEYQRADEAHPTRGSAEKLEYDLQNEVIKFMNNALLNEGPHRISGDTIVYNVLDDRVIADSDGQGSVHITIDPNESNTSESENSPPQ